MKNPALRAVDPESKRMYGSPIASIPDPMSGGTRLGWIKQCCALDGSKRIKALGTRTMGSMLGSVDQRLHGGVVVDMQDAKLSRDFRGLSTLIWVAVKY